MKTAEELLDQGYRNSSPSQESFDIDFSIAKDTICDKCGSNDMTFAPRTKFNLSGGYDSYRAFIICKNCGNKIEF